MVSRALLVAAGGTLGVAARLLLGLAVAEFAEAPDAGGIPIAILLANVAGSFLLGALVARMPSPTGLRLFLGTGLISGFTTYSALALDAVQLWGRHPLVAVAYALGSVVLGLAAAIAGMRIARPREVAP